jgi:hypothetical protein
MPRLIRSDTPKPLAVRLIGRIEGCTNPESAELLPDGETFVFGNCTMIVGHPAYRAGAGLVYLKGEAFISRARITARDQVRLEERRLVTGLTGTLGIDILRVATRRFPVGTAFIAEGGRPITLAGAKELYNDPADLRPRALAFDPVGGAVLGAIPLDDGSPIGRKFNGFDQPNGMAANAAGDLFVGDIPNSNPVAQLPSPVRSAVYRIPHAALDGLAEGSPESVRPVERIVIPGFVNGVTVSPIDQSVHIVSCSLHDPVQGGVYRLTDADFAAGRLPDPLVQGLGILDGVGVTRRGSVLASTPRTGELHLFSPDGEHRVLKVEGENICRMVADFNVCYPKVLDGEPALLVPDISVGKPKEDATVSVVDLSGY